jgi:L-seryl-tRNA(Ser) seleniumtransferase
MGATSPARRPAARRLDALRTALVAGGADADATTVLEVASDIAQTAGISLSDEEGDWGEIYKEIGVVPVINATGSVTILGGSTPHPEVSAAMDKANSAFVPLWELQKVAGAAIAKMVGVPSAMVSSGCGGAMMLAAAAALAGDDVAAIEALPDTSSLAKDEILIMTRQRYKFDRCFEAAGAKLVDWGEPDGPISIEEMVAAIGPRTCAVAYVANENHADPYPYDYSKGPLPDLQELIDVAHAHGLYVIVDAAGQIYPLDCISKYVSMGADASCVACKYMGASQSSGVLLGQEEFVHKALLNSFTVRAEPSRAAPVCLSHCRCNLT